MEENNIKNENEHTYDNGLRPKEVILPDDYPLYQKGFRYKLINRLIIGLFIAILFFPKAFVWGYKVNGRKNKKHLKGAVVVCNHIHPLDAFMICTSNYSKMFYVTMLQSNLGFGFISSVFRAGGAVPIPTERKLLKRFNKETPEILKNGSPLLIYPEAALIPYCDHIRNFLPGAFHFAVMGNGKIVPTVMTFHKPKGLYKLTRRNKPCIQYNILEPYYVKDMGNKRLTIDTATAEVNRIMTDYFNEHSDYYK